MATDAQQRVGTITCLDCGAENPEGETSCATCGASLDHAAAKALIGTYVLGVYEILDVLGQGGMSVVYKAKHKLTDQLVALKILPPELAVHSGLRARFLEEAKALARLEHPNIVRLYHFEEETGRFVLAMQYVEGVTFERRIFKAKRLGWREATTIMCEVLRALEYAHARGVVHRDIKPSNVIVRSDNTAMVMDFGIAKITADSTRLTATGQTMGTVRYMSPEQVRGHQVDYRSDLYSVGVALFEGVVGDTPFDGSTHFEIMNKHLSAAPPLARDMGADVPPELDEILQRAMRKEPAERWGSAKELREALEGVLALPDRETRPAPAAPAAAAMSARPPAREEERLTGLAARLEPSGEVAALRPKRRTALWIGLAAVVVAASVGVIVVMNQGGPAGASDAPRPTQSPAAFRDPLLVPGLQPVVDRRFEGPALVRVISARPLDAEHVSRVYQRARTRFEQFVATKHIGSAVTIEPLNLVIVPPELMCSATLWADRAEGAPADCATLRHRYLGDSKTLYVLDSQNLETTNIPQGSARHLCMWTLALLEIGCNKNILPPFDLDVEGSAP